MLPNVVSTVVRLPLMHTVGHYNIAIVNTEPFVDILFLSLSSATKIKTTTAKITLDDQIMPNTWPCEHASNVNLKAC